MLATHLFLGSQSLYVSDSHVYVVYCNIIQQGNTHIVENPFWQSIVLETIAGGTFYIVNTGQSSLLGRTIDSFNKALLYKDSDITKVNTQISDLPSYLVYKWIMASQLQCNHNVSDPKLIPPLQVWRYIFTSVTSLYPLYIVFVGDSLKLIVF